MTQSLFLWEVLHIIIGKVLSHSDLYCSVPTTTFILSQSYMIS